MDLAQQAFLKERGYANDKSIVDCNPTAQTVTFADGTVRTVCDVYSRTMGYHRPVHFWNKGKQQEHKDRKHFLEAGQGAQALMDGQSRPELAAAA